MELAGSSYAYKIFSKVFLSTSDMGATSATKTSIFAEEASSNSTQHTHGQGEKRRGQIGWLLESLSGGGFPTYLTPISGASDEHDPYLESFQWPAPLHGSVTKARGIWHFDPLGPSLVAQRLSIKSQGQDKKGRGYYKYHHILCLKGGVFGWRFKFLDLSSTCRSVLSINSPELFMWPIGKSKHITDHEWLSVFQTAIMVHLYAQGATDYDPHIHAKRWFHMSSPRTFAKGGGLRPGPSIKSSPGPFV